MCGHLLPGSCPGSTICSLLYLGNCPRPSEPQFPHLKQAHGRTGLSWGHRENAMGRSAAGTQHSFASVRQLLGTRTGCIGLSTSATTRPVRTVREMSAHLSHWVSGWLGLGLAALGLYFLVPLSVASVPVPQTSHGSDFPKLCRQALKARGPTPDQRSWLHPQALCRASHLPSRRLSFPSRGPRPVS